MDVFKVMHKKQQIPTNVSHLISIHRINSYLAHVKLQTSHVPLNGFNLLQKDRDSTLFYYSLWQHDYIWHKVANITIISVDIMRQLVCRILNATISQLIFTPTAHFFPPLSQFFLHYSSPHSFFPFISPSINFITSSINSKLHQTCSSSIYSTASAPSAHLVKIIQDSLERENTQTMTVNTKRKQTCRCWSIARQTVVC